MSKQKYPQSSTSSEGGTEKKGRESYSSKVTHAKQDKRRKEADLRQLKYDDLTVDQRFRLIKSRPGESKREFDRLVKQVAAAKAAPKPAPKSTPAPKKVRK